jgi:hypothetical protein
MIRQGAEMLQSSSGHASKKSNGQNGDWHDGDWHDDVMNQDMEIESHQNNSNWDRMDTEEGSDNQMDYNQLLQDTLNYGAGLQAEFKDDPRREVGKALEDAFALMAYQDPLSHKEVAHLLDPNGRVAVAEELNAAILCEYFSFDFSSFSGINLSQCHLANPRPQLWSGYISKPRFSLRILGREVAPEPL